MTADSLEYREPAEMTDNDLDARTGGRSNEVPLEIRDRVFSRQLRMFTIGTSELDRDDACALRCRQCAGATADVGAELDDRPSARRGQSGQLEQRLFGEHGNLTRRVGRGN